MPWISCEGNRNFSPTKMAATVSCCESGWFDFWLNKLKLGTSAWFIWVTASVYSTRVQVCHLCALELHRFSSFIKYSELSLFAQEINIWTRDTARHYVPGTYSYANVFSILSVK